MGLSWHAHKKEESIHITWWCMRGGLSALYEMCWMLYICNEKEGIKKNEKERKNKDTYNNTREFEEEYPFVTKCNEKEGVPKFDTYWVAR